MNCQKAPTPWRPLLEAIFEPDDLIEIRFLPPGDGRASLFATGPDGIDVLESAIRRRSAVKDVYFGVNPRASEARGDDSVEISRAVWADFDGCDVETAVERLGASDLPPVTALVSSGHGVHAYWRLSEPINPQQFYDLQARLARLLRSDPSVKNPERIARLPGTRHVTKGDGAECRIIEVAGSVVELAQIEAVLPPPIPPKPPTAPARPASTPNGTPPLPIRRASEKVLQQGVSEGERDNSLFSLACDLAAADVPEAEAERLVLEAAARCSPPFPEKEALAKVRSAYARPRRLAPSVQRALVTVVGTEPRPGPEIADDVDDAALLHLPRTDVGNAERLVARFGADLRHVHGLGWLVWDGARWAPDQTYRVQALAQETVRLMLREAEAAPSTEARDWHLKWLIASDNEPRIRRMLEMTKPLPGIALKADALDTDPMLLNCANGTVDLRTGKRQPHDRRDLITRLAGAPYEPNATAPLFEELLARIFRATVTAHPDWLGWFQKAMGYCITGSVDEQCLLLWHGDGANGKSVTAGAISAALGDYAGLGAPDLLIASRHDRHPTELADLRGRRLVICSESGEERRLAEARVKLLTGEKRIKGRGMRQDFIEFDATHKFLFMSNHRPRIRGGDLGIWRRIRLMPFTETISDEEKDPELPQKLQTQLAGIVRWLVKGAVAWAAQGLGDHPVVIEATEAYRATEDVVSRFIEEECELAAHYLTGATDLYNGFKRWCERVGERPGTQRAFGTALATKGFRNDEGRLSSGRKAWSGIALRSVDGGLQ